MHDLPVELWRHIFEYAIHDAKLLDPLYDGPTPSLQQQQQQEQQQRQARYDRFGQLRRHGRTDSTGQFGDITVSDDNDSSNEANGPSSVNASGNDDSISTADSASTSMTIPTLRLKMIRSQMNVDIKTKLAIVSTSSQWRRIGLPYLFQAVTLSSLRQLELLTALVRASRYRYVPGPHNIKLFREGKGTGYGVFIRRIETRIDLGIDPSDHSTYADLLSDLLRCCPNIRIYINQNTQAGIPTPSLIINALHDAVVDHDSYCSKEMDQISSMEIGMQSEEDFAPSIQRLEWSGREGLPVGDLTYLLRSTPHLRKLILGPIFLSSTRLSDTLSNPSIPLRYLQSLHIDLTSLHRAYIRYTRRWQLPSLQHLQVLIGPVPWLPDLLFFLDPVGLDLSSLHLKVRHHSSMLTENWSDILALCPNLTSLIFDVSAMPVLPPDVSLDRLKMVGLEGCHPDFRPRDEYDRPESDRKEQLCEHLSSLMLRKGTVRSVRMMDDGFLRFSRRADEAASGIPGLGAGATGTMGWDIRKLRRLSREVKIWKEWSLKLKLAGMALTNRDGGAIC